MFLEPSAALNDTKKAPYSKIYFSSFLGRLNDTFNVLAGGWRYNNGEDETYGGILDILIFPSIARYLDKLQFRSPPGNFILTKIAFVLTLTTVLIALAITILVSPIVAIVHLFFHFKSKDLSKTIGALQLSTEKAIPITSLAEKTTPNSIDQKDNLTKPLIAKPKINNFPPTLASINIPSDQAITVELMNKYAPNNKITGTYLKFKHKKNLALANGLKEIHIEINARNCEGITTILKTNWLGITRCLNEARKLEQVQALITEKQCITKKELTQEMDKVYKPLSEFQPGLAIISAYGDNPDDKDEQLIRTLFSKQIS